MLKPKLSLRRLQEFSVFHTWCTWLQVMILLSMDLLKLLTLLIGQSRNCIITNCGMQGIWHLPLSDIIPLHCKISTNEASVDLDQMHSTSLLLFQFKCPSIGKRCIIFASSQLLTKLQILNSARCWAWSKASCSHCEFGNPSQPQDLSSSHACESMRGCCAHGILCEANGIWGLDWPTYLELTPLGAANISTLHWQKELHCSATPALQQYVLGLKVPIPLHRISIVHPIIPGNIYLLSLQGFSFSSSLHSPKGRCLWNMQHSASTQETVSDYLFCQSPQTVSESAIWWQVNTQYRKAEAVLFEDFLFKNSLSTTSSDHFTACIRIVKRSRCHKHQTHIFITIHTTSKVTLYWMFQQGLLTFFGRLGVSLRVTTSAAHTWNKKISQSIKNQTWAVTVVSEWKLRIAQLW